MNNTASAKSHPDTVLHVTVNGREWNMERAADLESLWEHMDVLNKDERIPYWTEIWPSSIALGEWLCSNSTRIDSKPALDMGCGIGLTALIGSSLGAQVIGMDYEPEALAFAQKNTVRNNVPSVCWAVMDWRMPAVRPKSLPFIWAGDIMYEARFAANILDFIDRCLADNGVTWIAEPCRAVYNVFRSMAEKRFQRCECVWETSVPAVIPQPQPVPVRVWELVR